MKMTVTVYFHNFEGKEINQDITIEGRNYPDCILKLFEYLGNMGEKGWLFDGYNITSSVPSV